MVKMSYYADYSNYTDMHEVDEDLRTIANYGGRWYHESRAGITLREMVNIHVDSNDYVASRCCTIQKK